MELVTGLGRSVTGWGESLWGDWSKLMSWGEVLGIIKYYWLYKTCIDIHTFQLQIYLWDGGTIGGG